MQERKVRILEDSGYRVVVASLDSQKCGRSQFIDLYRSRRTKNMPNDATPSPCLSFRLIDAPSVGSSVFQDGSEDSLRPSSPGSF